MKRFRAPREVLAEVAAVLSAKTAPVGRGKPLQEIVDLLASGRHYFWTAVYLVIGEQVICQASHGPACDHPVVRLGEGLVGSVAKTGTYVSVADVSQSKEYLRCFAETQSELAVPIKIGTHVLGVINVESVKLYGLPTKDRVLLEEIARQLARFLSVRGKYITMKAREKAPPPDDKPVTAKLRVADLPFLKPDGAPPEGPSKGTTSRKPDAAEAVHATATAGDRSR